MKQDKIAKFVRRCLKFFHITLKEDHEKLCIQIFKFIIVGGIATIIDFVFLYLFKEFLHFPVVLSNTLSFSISVIYNYIASVQWVFEVDHEKDQKRQFVLFIILSVIGLFLNDFIMWLCIKLMAIYYLLAKVIATIIVMVFNFVTRKIFLEKHH